jgi:hypothetical protein
MFFALWGGLAVIDLTRPAGGMVAGAAVVMLVAGCGVGLQPMAAAIIAGIGWLLLNGFVQHQYGELGFGSTSWALLALVLVVGLAVSLRTSRPAHRR